VDGLLQSKDKSYWFSLKNIGDHIRNVKASTTVLVHLDSMGKLLDTFQYPNPLPKDTLFGQLFAPKMVQKNDSTLIVFDYYGYKPNSGYRATWQYNTHSKKMTKNIVYKTTFFWGITENIVNYSVWNAWDGGYIIDDISSAVKLDSCGYGAESPPVKLVYRIDTIIGRTVILSIVDSQSQYCDIRWTIEGTSYRGSSIRYTFSSDGIKTVKLWGFLGNQTDSLYIKIPIGDTSHSSIANPFYSHIAVGPSPASDQLSIAIEPLYHGSYYATLYHAMGSSCLSISSAQPSFTLYTSHLAEGIYFLELADPDHLTFYRQKIMIQH